jgi:hypothetical protein
LVLVADLGRGVLGVSPRSGYRFRVWSLRVSGNTTEYVAVFEVNSDTDPETMKEPPSEFDFWFAAVWHEFMTDSKEGR